MALIPRAAGAGPIDDKQRQANQLAGQIAALGDKESALAERFNQATLHAQAVQAQVDAAKARLAQANASASAARTQLNDAAVQSYIRGTTTSGSAAAHGDPAVSRVYTDIVTSRGTDALDQVRATTMQVNEQQAQLAGAQRQAKAAVADIDARRNDVQKTQDNLKATLAQVKGQLAGLVAQAEAAQRAADAARAQALARAAADRASRSRSDLSVAITTVAAPNPNAGAAVSEALRQVGKPYQWGAAGPDSFDCSGLTLWAWRAGGVSLPHYTGAQYSSTTHISLAQLQPGDLVYNRSMGHMAMYIGNGQMVEAPHTGANVRVVPLRSDMTLASRP